MSITTTVMQPLFPSRDPFVRMYGFWTKDRITAETGTTLTLSASPQPATLQAFKNGALLDDPDDYTLSGQTITLDTAAISGDIFWFHYLPRQA